MVGTATQYAVIRLSPKEERLALVVDLAALREALELAPGQFRFWSGGEAAVVPFVVLPDHVQEELTAFGQSLLQEERPTAEIPAEVRFVMDEIGPMVWVRLQRGHLGILLEAVLNPEAF